LFSCNGQQVKNQNIIVKQENLKNEKMKNYAYEYIPAYYDEIVVFDYLFKLHHNFSNVLLFKNTITIPPHAKVTDKDTSHHYSYCKENKVGFHSDPINLNNSKSESIYYFLQNIFNQNNRPKKFNSQIDSIFNLLPSFFSLKIKSEEFDNILEASINRVSITDKDTSIKSLKVNLSILDKLLIVEDILFHYFNIRQYIIYEK
jgi:hypothetical protein